MGPITYQGTWTLSANAYSVLCESHTLPLVDQRLYLLIGEAMQFLLVCHFEEILLATV